MAVTGQTIDYIAKLARLKISEEHKERLTRQMQDIITFVEKLDELDTAAVDTTDYILKEGNKLREDVVTTFDRQKILSVAPEVEMNCIKVPKVVE